MPSRAATRRTPPPPPRRGGTPRRAPAAVLDLVHVCRQQAAIAGKCWGKSEDALETLVRKLGTDRVVGIEDGVYAKIVDLFAEKQTVIVPKAMRRYRLVICDANGKEIRLRDRVARKGKRPGAAKPKPAAKPTSRRKAA